MTLMIFMQYANRIGVSDILFHFTGWMTLDLHGIVHTLFVKWRVSLKRSTVDLSHPFDHDLPLLHRQRSVEALMIPSGMDHEVTRSIIIVNVHLAITWNMGTKNSFIFPVGILGLNFRSLSFLQSECVETLFFPWKLISVNSYYTVCTASYH